MWNKFKMVVESTIRQTPSAPSLQDPPQVQDEDTRWTGLNLKILCKLGQTILISRSVSSGCLESRGEGRWRYYTVLKCTVLYYSLSDTQNGNIDPFELSVWFHSLFLTIVTPQKRTFLFSSSSLSPLWTGLDWALDVSFKEPKIWSWTNCCNQRQEVLVRLDFLAATAAQVVTMSLRTYVRPRPFFIL